MGPRGISLELPFGVDFMKFGLKKKKICSKYTSTPLSRKHELLMSIVCIYVQSTTTRKTSLPMDDGLGLANELERGPRAGTGAQPRTGRFQPHRRPGRGQPAAGPLFLSGAFSEPVLLRWHRVSYGLFPVLALLLGLLFRSLSSDSQLASASAGSSFRICSTVF